MSKKPKPIRKPKQSKKAETKKAKKRKPSHGKRFIGAM